MRLLAAAVGRARGLEYLRRLRAPRLASSPSSQRRTRAWPLAIARGGVVGTTSAHDECARARALIMRAG
ncbi:hypothetical protein EON67_07960, partial [archaeon]